MTLLKTLRTDYNTHGRDWTRPGFQTLAVYRVGRRITQIRNRWVKKPLHMAARAAHVFCRNFYGIELPFEATVGEGVVFEHQGGIVIHGNATIGTDCIIRQGVTLGMRRMGIGADKAPMLGNGVSVGAGAKIIGDVYVGSYSSIGANAVVTKDVEPYSVMVGVPAKKIRSYE